MADGTARDFLSDGYRSRRQRSQRRRTTRLLWILGSAAVAVLAAVLVIVLVVVPALRPPSFSEASLYSTLALPSVLGIPEGVDPAPYDGFLTAGEQRDEAGMFVSEPASGPDACTEYQYGDWLISSTQPESSAADVFTVYQLTAEDTVSFGTSARLFTDEAAALSYRQSIEASLTECIGGGEADTSEGSLAVFDAAAVPLDPVVSIRGGAADGEAATVQAHLQRGNVVVVVWLWYLDRPQDSTIIEDLTAVATVFADAKA